MRLRPDMLVDDVMRRWPATVRVFLQRRMKCVGCAFGPFHSLADACIEHACDQQDFLTALESMIEETHGLTADRREEPIGEGPE